MTEEQAKQLDKKVKEFNSLKDTIESISDILSFKSHPNIVNFNKGDTVRFVVSVTYGNGTSSKKVTIRNNTLGFKEIERALKNYETALKEEIQLL